MSDTYTETSTTSYGDRIKKSFGGMITGIALFFGSFAFLWWNEGNNVDNIKKELYIEKNAIQVEAAEIDRANDGKLIAVAGTAKATVEELTDWQVTVKNALSLKHDVEMYQWVENKETRSHDNMGGSQTTTTTYSYQKEWSSSYNDSSKFRNPEGHSNPNFPIQSGKVVAPEASLGQYKLNQQQVSSIGGSVSVPELPEELSDSVGDYKLISGSYYPYDYDPANPRVGDVKITFSYVPSGAEVSVMGQQRSNNTISKVSTDNGDIYLQYDGNMSKNEMLHKFKRANTMMTNVFRLLGWLMMFMGLKMLADPLVALAKVLPFLANIVSFITGVVFFFLSVMLSLLTIAIAWLAYRPVLSIVLFIVIGGLAFMCKKYISAQKAAATATGTSDQQQPVKS